MTWIRTGSSDLTGRWGSADTENFARHGGIGHIEWFNIDTGAGYLLATDGEWRTGGKFHLLFKSAGTQGAVDVSILLWPAEQTTFPIDPSEWSTIKSDLVKCVDQLLGAAALPAPMRK